MPQSHPSTHTHAKLCSICLLYFTNHYEYFQFATMDQLQRLGTFSTSRQRSDQGKIHQPKMHDSLVKSDVKERLESIWKPKPAIHAQNAPTTEQPRMQGEHIDHQNLARRSEQQHQPSSSKREKNSFEHVSTMQASKESSNTNQGNQIITSNPLPTLTAASQTMKSKLWPDMYIYICGRLTWRMNILSVWHRLTLLELVSMMI